MFILDVGVIGEGQLYVGSVELPQSNLPLADFNYLIIGSLDGRIQ